MSDIQQPRPLADAARQTPLVSWLSLLIAPLLLALAYDQFAAPYQEAQETLQDVEVRLQKAQTLAQIAPRLRQQLEALTERSQIAQARAYRADTLDAAQEALRQDLQSALSAIYLQPELPPQVQATGPNGVAATDAQPAALSVQLRAMGVPQQLYALELELARLGGKLHLTELQAQVLPDPARASQQLQLIARIDALYIPASFSLPHAPAPAAPR